MAPNHSSLSLSNLLILWLVLKKGVVCVVFFFLFAQFHTMIDHLWRQNIKLIDVFPVMFVWDWLTFRNEIELNQDQCRILIHSNESNRVYTPGKKVRLISNITKIFVQSQVWKPHRYKHLAICSVQLLKLPNFLPP